MNVKVLIPKRNSELRKVIKKGSAIVTTGDIAKGAIAYYEGNIYGASNIKTFEDKVFHATSRLEHQYPTVAKVYVTEKDMLVVGTFDSETRILTVFVWVNNKDSPHTIKYHPKQYSFILLGGNL